MAQDSTQSSVSGVLSDAQTGETLPAANIQIKDTYRGTITNMTGQFEIKVSSFPVTLVFRYIGYETKEVTYNDTVSDVDVLLEPVSIELDELVFTGEDPAMHIMERVILRKQIWRENLESWKAEAYTRQNLSNDEGIVSITESYSTTWWHKTKGFREVLTDKRQTNNILPDQNFAGSSYLPNFYDDDIRIAGFDVVGVTHPDAFKYYRFKIAGTRQIDNDIVYDIEVIPITKLQPSFEGTVSVLGSEYALIEVNLIPGESIFFPPPVSNVDFSYQQQFNNYGGEFWLPTDIRINGTIEIGFPGFRIPEIKFNQAASILNYEVNIPVPDSLYEKKSMIRTDTLSVKENRRFNADAEAIPLSLEEKDAYDTIDSTKTLDEAFRPTGILADLARSTDDSDSSDKSGFWKYVSISPDARFNRVESLYAGANISVRVNNRLSLRTDAGYSVGREFIGYGVGATGRLGKNRRTFLTADYSYNTTERVVSDQYTPLLTSTSMLFGNRDYFDFYQAERAKVSLAHRFRYYRLRPELSFQHERGRSLDLNTNYSFIGGITQRPNPDIQDGIINSLGFELKMGEDAAPFGIAGSTGAGFRIEHARKSFGSDFDFTRYDATINIRINTFLQRRFLPNALDIRLNAFTSSGGLPVQRLGSLDTNLNYFTPFGTFKSLINRQQEGEHGFAAHWEHNFRTVPFELIGARGLVRKGIGVIIFGSLGRTWIDNERLQQLSFTAQIENKWLHEVGLSINNIFGMFRIDAAYRIDKPGFYAGFSATRFF